MQVDQHYENFPVASVLVPAGIRPYVLAIYRFSRYADDIADEDDAPPAARLEALEALERDIRALFSERTTAKTNQVVLALTPLKEAKFSVVTDVHFLNLLSAFKQDLIQTRYPTEADLLDYCARSANPVGRLMLALIGVQSPSALTASDAICTALQLINFWQDVSIDLARGRIYVPQADFDEFKASEKNFPNEPAHRALFAHECQRAEIMMQKGLALLPHLRGRFKFEIALTMAGGLRILEKISNNHFDTTLRPTLRWYDSPRILFLAVRQLRRAKHLFNIERKISEPNTP